MTKGRGERCKDTGVTTVNRHNPCHQGIDISLGGRGELDCTNELTDYTNK